LQTEGEGLDKLHPWKEKEPKRQASKGRGAGASHNKKGPHQRDDKRRARPDERGSGGQVSHLLQDLDLLLPDSANQVLETRLPGVEFQNLRGKSQKIENKAKEKNDQELLQRRTVLLSKVSLKFKFF
jgi:hypothetical protein